MSVQLYLYPGAEKPAGEERMRRCASPVWARPGDRRRRLFTHRAHRARQTFFPDAPGIFVPFRIRQAAGLARYPMRRWGWMWKKIGNAILLPSPGGSFMQKRRSMLRKVLEAFFAVWTAKESYVKLLGQGIDDGFARFSVVQKAVLQKRWGMCNFALSFWSRATLCAFAEKIWEKFRRYG